MYRIGVFFGSRSPEHDVSIITGQLIIAGLKQLGYQVIPVYINKQGKWLIGKPLDSLKFFTNPDFKPELGNINQFYLDLDESIGKESFKQKKVLGKKFAIDIAFPAFHGQNGEDGTFQGMCELLDIPYVGCDLSSSAIAMDKVLTKMIYQANDIPTTKFIYFYAKDWERNKSEIIKKIQLHLTFPLVVKPARLGSSIGIAKVKSKKELELSVEVALHYDEKVLVEECVNNLADITCAVIGTDNPRASLLQESVFEDDLFSYEDKYLKEGGAQLGKAKQRIIIPARLDKEMTEKIRSLAITIFQITGCCGIARIDFLYNKKTKKLFANEINPLPGTLYHHLWKKSGIELPDLLQKLVQYAIERHENKKRITYTFQSDLLKQANSIKLKSANKI